LKSPAFTIGQSVRIDVLRNAALICSTVSAWIFASRSASHLNGRLELLVRHHQVQARRPFERPIIRRPDTPLGSATSAAVKPVA